MILRTEDWNRRNALRKLGGWSAAIVYEQKSMPGQIPACAHRLRVKDWATARWGKPARRSGEQIHNAASEWLIGEFKTGEYIIAFRSKRMRDWALLL